MKNIILFTFLLSLAACNNSTNKTAERVNLSAYEKKTFLSLPHEENSSLLRNKLLNLQLTHQLNVKDESVIEDNDSFRINGEDFNFNSNDEKDFQKQKKLSAQLIVSYKDHLDFYFVPAGKTSDEALSDLHLNSEEEKDLVWAFGKPSMLSKGQSYFLIKSTKEEILRNDFKFSHTLLKKNESVSKTALTYRFTNNQKIVLNFQLSFLLRETYIAEVSGQMRSCKRDELEAGLCSGPCTVKIEDVSGNFIAQNWAEEKIPLKFVINGMQVNAEDLKPILNSDHTLTFTIELSQFTKDATVELQVLPIKMPAVTKTVQGFDYSTSCRSRGWLNKTLDLTPQVQNFFNVDVFGREMKI